MAEASVLMRAFRAADQSYHTWRAGSYDPNMDDATGDQAPPFPIIDYSDPVVIGFIGGPLARSDAEAFTVPGLGTSGTPITFLTAGVTQTTGTECRDFKSISVWVVITNAPTTPAVLSVRSIWTNTSSVGGAGDYGIQASDDAIVSGVSPQNRYIAEFTVTGTSAAVGFAHGPYNVPVRGRLHTLSLDSDTNDVQGYVLVMRLA